MRVFAFLALLAAFYWYGSTRDEHSGASAWWMPWAAAPQVTKCVAGDGSVFYGQVPPGTRCATEGHVTLVRPAGGTGSAAADPTEPTPGRSAPPRGRAAPSTDRCDGRVYCSQMTSCAEAEFFLRHCPGVKMDGDHDGIPCEQQWCG